VIFLSLRLNRAKSLGAELLFLLLNTDSEVIEEVRFKITYVFSHT
jgi:hypothetical protein